jgi:hypothetical protein
VFVRIGWKSLPKTNTLDYYKHWQITDLKRFMTLVTGKKTANGPTDPTDPTTNGSEKFFLDFRNRRSPISTTKSSGSTSKCSDFRFRKNIFRWDETDSAKRRVPRHLAERMKLPNAIFPTRSFSNNANLNSSYNKGILK